MSQCDLFGAQNRPDVSNGLEAFCEHIANKCDPTGPLTPDELAAQFSRYFKLSPPIVLRDESRLAKKLGIQDFAIKDLPLGMAGFNAKEGSAYTLYVRQQDNRIRQGHTLLHEVYELIQTRLREVLPQHRRNVSRRGDINEERAADTFAASVLMPEENFLKHMLESGLDVIDLRHRFGRSYSSVLIHMARAMGRLGVPFVGLLYESFDQQKVCRESTGTRYAGDSTKPNGLRLAYRWTVLGLSHRMNPVLASHLPTHGDPISPECLARLVRDHCQPVYVRRAHGFDFFGLDDLVLLGRPVVWRATGIAKVIVIGVRCEQHHLFQPQLKALSYRTIDQIRGLEMPTLPVAVPMDCSDFAMNSLPPRRTASRPRQRAISP